MSENIAENEVWINPHLPCPNCGSRRIDQISSEDRCTIEYYHCIDCGAWYDENGELEDLDSEFD